VVAVKRYATGRGNADKAAMVTAIQARGFRPADDNEADAIALLLWATDPTGGRA
jgi:Holliday junction resolvasome RuvABC endonuclease subunit